MSKVTELDNLITDIWGKYDGDKLEGYVDVCFKTGEMNKNGVSKKDIKKEFDKRVKKNGLSDKDLETFSKAHHSLGTVSGLSLLSVAVVGLYVADVVKNGKVKNLPIPNDVEDINKVLKEFEIY